MNDFRDVLAVCDLRDLGYIGSPFTWYNNRDGNQKFFEILANSLQFELFHLGSAGHGQVVYSDHCPIWFNTIGYQQKKVGLRIFRFEAMWIKDDECTNIIEEVWATRTLDGSLGEIMHLIKALWLQFDSVE